MSGLNREGLEKFYTSDDAVSFCIEHFKKTLNPQFGDLIIEPSAGNGQFINGIKNLTDKYYFCDIAPEHKEIVSVDYFNLDCAHFRKLVLTKIHVIGNPPFGRQSSLAWKFIKKTCSYADTISFILPKSFKKSSMKSKWPNNFHLVFEEDLKDNSFLLDGQPFNVPCVFQIWEVRDVPRPTLPASEPYKFKFVKKDENPHVSFRRVGVNAGVIDTDITDKSVQSHYFIRFDDEKNIDQLVESLQDLQFSSSNTVGPRSVNKEELISEYNFIVKEVEDCYK